MLSRTFPPLVRNPVPDDTKAFYSWFAGQTYRTAQTPIGGYPAIRLWPSYGKRWTTGYGILAFVSGFTLIGVWIRPERERYGYEIETEAAERAATHAPYQQAEINLRYLVSAYKRHRFEKECLVDKGYVGLTSQRRKFYYHDDVWRPDLHDVIRHPWMKFGGPWNSYNWALGYV